MTAEMGFGKRPVKVSSGPEVPHWGKYRGIVVATNDPAMRGRIKAVVPYPFGDVVLDWAEPCFAGNMFDVPPLNAGVWIEFEQGNTSNPIWVGRWYRNGEAPGQSMYEELQEDDEEESASPEDDVLHKPFHDHAAGEYYTPHRREWRSPTGHRIVFDDWKDADGEKRGLLSIEDRDGRKIEFSEEGFIDVYPGGDSQIRLHEDGTILVIGTVIKIGTKDGPHKKLLTETDFDTIQTQLNTIRSAHNSHSHTGNNIAPTVPMGSVTMTENHTDVLKAD